MKDTGCSIDPISSGCFTAIISPEGEIIGDAMRSGEGDVIADLDFWFIDKRKRLMGLCRPLQPTGFAEFAYRPDPKASYSRG